MRPPKSFTEVEGWRESFKEAAEKQEETRASSLFPEVPTLLLGEPVRQFSLADWTLLDLAGNPFVSGGELTAAHAISVVWVLRKRWRWAGHGRVARALRRLLLSGLLVRYKFNESAIVDEVGAFMDSAFMDMPGRYDESDRKGGFNPVNMPRQAFEISLCCEVAAAFPSFSYAQLRTMPLAQFWQWLNAARKKADPEYRNSQPTDLVNRHYLGKLNAIKRAHRAFQQPTK